MYCSSISECFQQISAYADGAPTGFPLLVDTENFNDFQEIMHRFSADDTKSIVYVSEHTFANGLPDFLSVFDAFKSTGNHAVAGLSQSLMLRGAAELDRQIDNLIGCSIKDHAIILLCMCRGYLEKFMQRDIRLDRKIIILEGEKGNLPRLRLAKDKAECIGKYDDGIKALLSHLEKMTDDEIASVDTFSVVTTLSPSLFANSLYAIMQSNGVYDTLVRKYKELSYSTERNYGTDEQWSWLLDFLSKRPSFSSLVNSDFGSTLNLATKLSDVYNSSDENKKWLFWLALKVFGVGADSYLSYALSKCDNYSSLAHHIYQGILDIDLADTRFEKFFSERKQLISKLPENLTETQTYCRNVGRHGKNAVYYLSDGSDDEEYTLMKIISQYDWGDDELIKAVSHASSALELYMRGFTFNAMNTRLSEKEAALRDLLTDYFFRYRIQKIKNRIEDGFLDRVEEYAQSRPFNHLQSRSSIVTAMDKDDTQAYFFDALGVEYLAFIQAKCEEYGLICTVNIGRCELPSITSKNKEFQLRFKTKDISDLDELKHHSQVYDYQTCIYPIHIFRELEIIDKELRRIRSQLNQSSIKRAVILSDHGASRLAVIYGQESSATLELEEKGIHSGRCCPSAEDPAISQAAYEDGYAVLANYERFKGSRKANLEVHGGASLEETVVPVITISLKPDKVTYYFVNSVLQYRVGKPCVIELFSTIPMNEPVLEVEGTFYRGEFTTDLCHAAFTLTEQKKAREYTATVYEGNTSTGVELTFRIERGTKINNQFI